MAAVPALASVVDKLAEPHRRVHASAAAIAQVYEPADPALGAFLREAKVAHLSWAARVKDVFFDPSVTKLDVVTDPHQCSFGKWLYSDETKALAKSDAAFGEIWKDVDWEHQSMHGGAIHVDELLAAGQRDEAAAYVLTEIVPASRRVIAGIDRLIAWDAKRLEGSREARRIYNEQTQPALAEVAGLLQQAVADVGDHMMTDEEMLSAARHTRAGVFILSVVAGALGVVLGGWITVSVVRALTRVMHDLAAGAEHVAAASGQVAGASTDMAEGASSQASSLEETAATLEELAAMTRPIRPAPPRPTRWRTACAGRPRPARRPCGG